MESRYLLAPLVVLGAGAACRNFGDSPPPRLAVTPPALAFTAVAGGIAPPPQALTIDAIGVGRLTWAARTDVPWVSVSPASGTAPAVAWVEAVTASLAQGTHIGALTVTTTSGPRMEVTVPVNATLAATVSLSGRWAGGTAEVSFSLNLAHVDTTLTGAGTIDPPQTALTVTGSYRHPDIALTMVAADSSVTTFTGVLVDANTIEGSLTGHGLVDYAVTIFRQ